MWGSAPGQSLQQKRRTPEKVAARSNGTRIADAVLSFAGQGPCRGGGHGLRTVLRACAKDETPNSRRRAIVPGRPARYSTLLHT